MDEVRDIQGGFTLIEIIMVIVILGIVGVITLRVLTAGVETFAVSRERQELYDQGRLALERMVRELRDANQIVSPGPGSSGSSINFVKAHSSLDDPSLIDPAKDITFELSGTDLIRRRNDVVPPDSMVLASNVSNFTVTHEGKRLVMVTGNGSISGNDALKQAIFEGFGYTVSAIEDAASPATYSSAASNNDVMYISETASAADVGTKARDLDIGIVVEQLNLYDEMGFSTPFAGQIDNDNDINITDNVHYVTSQCSYGNLVIYIANGAISNWGGGMAAGVQVLATEDNTGDPALFVFDRGAALTGGVVAANRRVGLFTYTSSPATWNANLLSLLKRTLDWAASRLGGDRLSLELSLTNATGGTVSMRSRAYARNIP